MMIAGLGDTGESTYNLVWSSASSDDLQLAVRCRDIAEL